jgi:DNA-binding PadR family transcriptional regulator
MRQDHRHDHPHDHDHDEEAGAAWGRGRRRGRGRAYAWAGGPSGFGPWGPGPGRGFGPGGRRGRGRARRGAIRAGILAVLADRPMHGYEVMTELAERSGGGWRPSPGSVYPTLQQLEDEDLVRGEEVDGKRVFRLTDAGRAEAERVTADGAPWDSLDDVGKHGRGLRTSVGQLAAAAMQVQSLGTDEQVAAAQAVLDDARKQIYRLLAD